MICRDMVWNCLPAISAILELLKKDAVFVIMCMIM